MIVDLLQVLAWWCRHNASFLALNDIAPAFHPPAETASIMQFYDVATKRWDSVPL